MEHLPEKRVSLCGAPCSRRTATGDTKRALQPAPEPGTAIEEASSRGRTILAEGLDETLTVMQFKLPQALARTLSTTNAIENLMSSIRLTVGTREAMARRCDDRAVDRHRAHRPSGDSGSCEAFGE